MHTKLSAPGMFAGLLGLLLTSHPAAADVLTPTSYSTPNGYGTASGGTFNYWDLAYTGTGMTMTDGAPLSGGLGDLTNGIIATNNWNNVENNAGTGPYVGWININPTITFQFAQSFFFDRVRIHVDDSDGLGGVRVPLSVSVGAGGPAATFPVTDPPGPAPLWLDFDLTSLNLSGNSLSVTLNRRDLWVFASEFEFTGRPAAAVPEPATLGLFGLAGLALLARRRLTARSYTEPQRLV